MRLLGAADSITALTNLLHRAYAKQVEMGLKPLAGRQDDETTRDRVSHGECLVAVLSEGGSERLVGTILFHEDEEAESPPWFKKPRVTSFSQFAVDPDVQGLGIGQKLLDVVEQRARAAGSTELALSMAEPDTALMNFYLKRGYRFIENWQWPYTNYKSAILSKTITRPARARKQQQTPAAAIGGEVALPSLPLAEYRFDELLEATAGKTPTPGGGAIASAVGALSGALAGMVVSYSVGKKNLAAHEPALQDAAKRLAGARELLLKLADEDAQAYGTVNELSRLPETDPRRAELPAAQLASVQVPLAVMAACSDLLRLMESLASMTNRHLRSDLAIAAVLAAGAARSSRWNVDVNLAGLAAEGDRREFKRQSDQLVADCEARAALVEKACGA